MTDEREMTLMEWCDKLPKYHLVNKELQDLLKKNVRFEIFKMAAQGVCKSIEYHNYIKENKPIIDEYDTMMKPLWKELKVGLDENPPMSLD